MGYAAPSAKQGATVKARGDDGRFVAASGLAEWVA